MRLSGLQRCACVVMLLACAGGLTHCSVPISERSKTTRGDGPPAQSPAQRAFNEAERAYQQKDYPRARSLFQAFARSFPQSALLGDAAFRLGEILYYEGNYEGVQETLAQFLMQFPRSHLAPDATYLLGLSRLQLRRFPQARAALEQAQRQFTDPGKQGHAALELARVSLAEGQAVRAIEELRTVMETRRFPDDVQQQGRDLILELVARRLTPAELADVKRRWPLEFPTDYVLLREAREAWSQTNAAAAQAFGEEFLTKFPRHPQGQEMRTFITTLAQRRNAALDRDKIGIVVPLSGRPGREWVSEVGESALHGIQVAFAREGFSPLRLEVRDSKADVSVAAAMVEDLIQNQHVMAIVGPVFNETVEAAAGKVAHYQVPLITPGAPASELSKRNPYVFRNSLTNRLEARRLAEYAVGTLGLRRMAILSPDNQAGRELGETFHLRVVELGGEVVTRESYTVNQVDFSPQMRRLGGRTDEEVARGRAEAEGAHPVRGGAEARGTSGQLPYEALYLPRSFERLDVLVAALTVFNITGITLLGESGWNHPELTRRGGAFVEGAVFMDGFFVGASDPQVREFVQAYRATFNSDPDLVAAQSYDAMLMLLRVLKQRPQTREQVKEALQNVRDFPGVTGRASTLVTGDMDKRLFALTVRGGRIIQLD
ncbi:MAG: penicillin-binding protein activator [Nitrospinae bacterium]|nr:penicillin-binding protein activator [Nitrospinota bacterium]